MVETAAVEGAEGGGRKEGLGIVMTALLLAAQMAGAGFLSLPQAVANTGWLGVAMMVVFCAAMGFSGTRLGTCWVILEQRWPALYGDGSRQPYMDIASQALGKPGRYITLGCVLVTVFGVTLVFLILMSSFLHDLVPQLSVCEWLLVSAAVVLPFTWLGTPKDFWQASVVAGVCTAFACIVILVEIIIEAPSMPQPEYRNPTVYSFALGFASILFSFGGASVFPTIQNDMADRSLFSRSVLLAFVALLSMYLPVAVAGYAVMGYGVEDNILLNVDTQQPIIKAAIVMEVLNLLGTYVIASNAMFQIIEEQVGIEKRFGWRRCTLRSSLVVIQVVIGLAVPSFGRILDLIGGSTITVCSFLLPGICYLRLADAKGEWKERYVPLWERTLLILTISVGVVGGIVSTASAVIAIINPESLGESCFVTFTS